MKVVFFLLLLCVVAHAGNFSSGWFQNQIQRLGRMVEKKSEEKVVPNRFHSMSFEEMKRYTGAKLDLDVIAENANDRSKMQSFGDEKLPDNFNVWDKWAFCESTFKIIQDQASCGSCFAVATASALQDRLCITSKGKNTTPLSSWDVVSCCENCWGSSDNGCEGGYPSRAYAYYSKTGIVSGGAYGDSKTCKPYPIKPDEKQEPTETKCQKSCQASYTKNTYDADKTKGGLYNWYNEAEEEAMKEIYYRGPITAGFQAKADLWKYKTNEVYKWDGKARTVGGHLIKIVGWGVTDDGKKYWQAINSWGEDFGDRGFFKFVRGINDCEIEGTMMGGNVDEKDLVEKRKSDDDNNNDKDSAIGSANVNIFLLAIMFIKFALF